MKKHSRLNLKISIFGKNKSEIQRVEIENIHTIHYLPNDPLYSDQWYLDQINLQQALDLWNFPNGDIPNSENILLVAVDTGVDWTHSDLVQNIWQNLDEDADNDGRTIECDGILNNNICNGEWVLDPDDLNGIDDDNWDADPTTLIDDLIGWDFVGNAGTADNNPKPNLSEEYYNGWYNTYYYDQIDTRFAEKTQFIGGIQLHPSRLIAITLDAGIGVGYVFGGVDEVYFAYNLGLSFGFRF